MGTVPKKIFPIEYAGFFEFNAEDVTDISLINAEETPNAKEIANEISKRYNAHEELVKLVQDCKTAIEDLHSERYTRMIINVPYPIYIRKQPILQQVSELLNKLL